MRVVERRKKVCAVTIIMLTLAAMYLIPFSHTAAVAGNLEPTAPPASTTKTLDEIRPTWSQNLPVGYDPKRNPHRDLEQAKSIAKNRKILMIVGGYWCEWCYILDNFLKDNPELYNNLKDNFVILKVHYSQENKNSEFLSDFPKIDGYPHFIILRNDGIYLGKQNTGVLESAESYSKKSFEKFIDSWR